MISTFETYPPGIITTPSTDELSSLQLNINTVFAEIKKTGEGKSRLQVNLTTPVRIINEVLLCGISHFTLVESAQKLYGEIETRSGICIEEIFQISKLNEK
ncbi:MAG: hypothetical protein GC181_09725 [Bacteroidetes bacterium]|nr:hypothetical protein [Bacteroidota bacterium]